MRLEIMRGHAGCALYLNDTRIAGPRHNGMMRLEQVFHLDAGDIQALRSVIKEEADAHDGR